MKVSGKTSSSDDVGWLPYGYRLEGGAAVTVPEEAEGYAEEKLTDIVAGRLAIVKTIAGSRTARDVRRKIKKTARHFQWLRVWEHEP